ncbi:hypothetical protein THARTR1_00980 [Trichoderma harzianum]|uniref:DDH domain-containing protein n=1 Tax=Trichoderma harzianum TaxID=5544 RepID=A0A2K0UP01_TRIHA|nr:hypothetical protein THARTR1_00980 [Trichoderma harzianum]
MFFYDSTLRLYINDTPLLISANVQQAARRAGAKLTWNNNGHVNSVSYDESRAICKELGIVILSVREYMHLARREPRVASDVFAEWLLESYTLSSDKRMIDFSGREVVVPPSRPGWFDLDDIGDEGLPTQISGSPAAGKWKFWTHEDGRFVSSAVRSFVTSAGVCSLDLGIPQFAIHPNLMIRECYRKEPCIMKHPMDQIWANYEDMTLRKANDELKQFFTLLDIGALKESHVGSDKFVSEKNAERIFDLSGKQRLIRGNFDNLQIVSLAEICRAVEVCPDAATYVIGHPNPDTDAIVSAVFEAARRFITYGQRCAVWAEKIPFVVEHLLGNLICVSLRQTPKFRPVHDLVLVDCHSVGKDCEHQVKSIIDHHIITRTFPYYVSVSQEVSWSSTLQVYIKFLGSGPELDRQSARLLLEATMLEAEPQLMTKMSSLDKLAFEHLRELAQDHTSYPELMKMLTGDVRVADPFMEDYKETLFGFAVIKTETLTCYKRRSEANNLERHLPLTVVKQVCYDSCFNSVRKERITMHFNDAFHDKGFRRAILSTIQRACEAFHGIERVSVEGSQNIKSRLAGQRNTSFMSLKQYWQVCQECVELHDTIMLKSLRNRNYVEFLDTVIRQGRWVMHGDLEPMSCEILEARPALIRPQEIDIRTGFPRCLESPNLYGDASLWRFWSPDREENVATRGHIFIMGQTCIDLKIAPDESTQNLTFRPIYRDIPELEYEIQSDGGNWITVNTSPRTFEIF